MSKTGQTIQLEVLTPVHIGMGRETDYLNGLDFTYQAGEYRVYNHEKILNGMAPRDLAAISGFLADGNYRQFGQYVNSRGLLNEQSLHYRFESPFGNAESIKRTYQDALGNWLIPGSSLKGALRSIILTRLFQLEGGQAGQYLESALLGNIGNNLMRYFQVTDCPLDEEVIPGILPTKIFSADENRGGKTGQWKHDRIGGHTERFDTRGFVSFYEMITGGTGGQFRITWGLDDFMLKKRAGDLPGPERLFTQEGPQWMLKAARENMANYLEREKDFFQKYPNSVLEEFNFMDQMDWLINENNKPGSFLLRLGANVGFHSITGDWKFRNDHSQTGRDPRSQAIRYKTRKFVFWKDEEGWLFYLPGFVKLTLKS